ncbi:MAG: hypothetical protein IRY89_12795 [Pseudolabrys sp.]|nr:hypothetical protein [Pseudolabrys sp.]
MPPMRIVVLAAALMGAAALLAGCENFDLDKLDIFNLNEKKKLPGERKELFPGGVPGVSQGIPPEYLKGHEQDQPGAAIPVPASQPGEQTATTDDGKTAAASPAAQEPNKPEAEPKPKPRPKAKPKAKAKPKPARQPEPETKTAAPSAAPQPGSQTQSQPWPASSPPQQGTAAPWPATEQNQVTAPWPTAPAPGTFSR